MCTLQKNVYTHVYALSIRVCACILPKYERMVQLCFKYFNPGCFGGVLRVFHGWFIGWWMIQEWSECRDWFLRARIKIRIYSKCSFSHEYIWDYIFDRIRKRIWIYFYHHSGWNTNIRIFFVKIFRYQYWKMF